MSVYTREQLVEEAQTLGFHATGRLFQDWISHGLLARAHSPGRGRGRVVGTWNDTQRELWLVLLAGRQNGVAIPDLCNAAIWFWYMHGSLAVPLTQVRRAMQTWAAARGTATRRSAKLTAKRALSEVDHPAARPSDRKRLVRAVEKAVWTGQIDRDEIRDIAHTIAKDAHREPLEAQFRFDADALSDLLEMNLRTLRALPNIPDEVFELARRLNLGGMRWYEPSALHAQSNPSVAPHMPPLDIAQEQSQACYTLLTLLGLIIESQTKPMPNLERLIALAPTETPATAATARGHGTGTTEVPDATPP